MECARVGSERWEETAKTWKTRVSGIPGNPSVIFFKCNSFLISKKKCLGVPQQAASSYIAAFDMVIKIEWTLLLMIGNQLSTTHTHTQRNVYPVYQPP